MELGWRKTWDDKDDDYVYCDTDGERIGRVYFGHMNNWRWFFAGSTGQAESRRMAMLAVEEAYESCHPGAPGDSLRVAESQPTKAR